MMRTDGLVDCPFLSPAGQCEIYDMRPFVCASYHVLCKPEDCDTDKHKKNIQMVNPAVIASKALDLGGKSFLAVMKHEFEGDKHSIMDAFKV